MSKIRLTRHQPDDAAQDQGVRKLSGSRGRRQEPTSGSGQPIVIGLAVCLALAALVAIICKIWGAFYPPDPVRRHQGWCRGQPDLRHAFEYGWSAKNEKAPRLRVYHSCLAAAWRSTRWTGVVARSWREAGGEIKIALREISVADIALLQDELRLHRTGGRISRAVRRQSSAPTLVARLLDMSGDELTGFATLEGGNHASLSALRSNCG